MKKSLLKLFSCISFLLVGCGPEQPFGSSLIVGRRTLVRNSNKAVTSLHKQRHLSSPWVLVAGQQMMFQKGTWKHESFYIILEPPAKEREKGETLLINNKLKNTWQCFCGLFFTETSIVRCCSLWLLIRSSVIKYLLVFLGAKILSSTLSKTKIWAVGSH